MCVAVVVVFRVEGGEHVLMLIHTHHSAPQYGYHNTLPISTNKLDPHKQNHMETKNKNRIAGALMSVLLNKGLTQYFHKCITRQLLPHTILYRDMLTNDA